MNCSTSEFTTNTNMKAEKVTVKIEMQALSIDCLKGMLANVIEQIEGEAESGHLAMADGDCIKWETVRESVVF